MLRSLLLFGVSLGWIGWVSVATLFAQANVATVPAKALTAEVAPAAQQPTKPTATQVVDFNAAIRGYAKINNVTLEQSLREALSYCSLSALMADESADSQCRQVGPGIYEVTAPQSFLKHLPAMIESFESGAKQIVVEVRMIGVSDETFAQLDKDLPGGWATGGLNAYRPEDKSYDSKPATNPFQLPSSSIKKSAQFASGVTQTVRANPCRFAKLNAEATRELLRGLQAQASTHVWSAPKVTMFPDQKATIADTTQRPFVVDVNPVTGEFGTAMQPVIEVLDEGLSIDLHVSLAGEATDVTSQISLTKIGKVETFTFVPEDTKEEATIQLPEQRVQKVAFSQRIDNGMSLLIAPRFIKETERVEKHGLMKRTIKSREHTLVLLRSTVVDG